MFAFHGIWIDDERKPSEYAKRSAEWIETARDYDEAIELLSASIINDVADETAVFFDHDLGTGKTGYDVAKWIVENEVPIKFFNVHSMNPVGRKNIVELLTHYGYKYN